jgi:hypothetical protein
MYVKVWGGVIAAMWRHGREQQSMVILRLTPRPTAL